MRNYLLGEKVKLNFTVIAFESDNGELIDFCENEEFNFETEPLNYFNTSYDLEVARINIVFEIECE
jgi:hypothetical protein